MERTQDVDVLSEACFPHLESAIFSSSNEKCSSAKVTEKLLHQGSRGHSAKLGDAAFMNSRNAHLDHLYNSNLVKMNSSLQNCELNVHPEFDGKPPLPKFSGHDLMRHAGIGRGKHRDRNSPVGNIEMNQLKSQQAEYEMNIENNPVSNSIEFPELKSVKIVSDLEAGKVVESSARCEPTNVNDMTPKGPHVHGHMKMIDSHFRDSEMKIRNTIDQYSREHEFRRMQNGFDKGYKGKPYRMPRFQNNGASSVQYKYDARPLQHFPITSNMKPPRTMKGNEGYYRQNDSRRNQSSKPPFPSDIDKMMYSKSRPNICPEKDIAGYNSNRNYVHNYPINKTEINSLMQIPESYVPRDMSSFKKRSFANKVDHVNNSKQWTSSRIHSDYGGPPAGCHRTVAVPNKSYESKHPASCLPSEKNMNNCAFVSKTNCRDSEALEHDECSHSCDKEPGRLRANCSTCHFGNKQYSHGNVNLCIDGNSNLSSPSAVTTNFPTNANDQAGDPNFSHYQSLRDVSLTEKSSHYPSGQFSCDSQCEQLSSHPKNNECISMPDQPLITETMQCPVSYSGLNSSSSGAQASYADIIRSPAVGSSKVSLSQVFHSSNGVSKTEVSSALVQDIPLPKENEQSSSSEWIISRLSQVNVNADSIHVINGMSPHHTTTNSPDGMHPRPIAVSVEKPSFYNTSLGVSKGLNSIVQQSSLSSPEKRVLECQLVEEHLCNLFTGKKPSEKFSSESPVAPPSPGENSSNTACANVRTDSIFSDSSSVCSSSSSIFKTEIQQHNTDTKEVAPPVVIMKNCMPSSNVSDISFGIEMDEIIQICSDSSRNSKTDSSSVSDSDLSSSKPVNITPDEKEAEQSSASNSVNVNFLIVGGKRFLWKESEVDASRCNLGHIMDFLQDSWHSVEVVADVDGKDSSDAIKYYSAE